MRLRLRHLWDTVSSGFWFVPSVMTALAAVLAVVMLHVDRYDIPSDTRIGWLYAGGADGAKTLLSTVAGSIITTAGVVFSITIAALTQASSQFGPRLLRNFIRDTSNQIVLGTFVATFLYCLLILRTIHGKVEDGVAFVPQASVTVAVLSAVASIAVLIYFIHHISILLQAPNIVAAVQADFYKVMDSLIDDQEGVSDPMRAAIIENAGLPANFDAESCAILSARDGYVQAIDGDTLVAMASKRGLILRLQCRPGDYVIAGNPVAHAWPGGQCDPKLAKRLNDAFICGTHRTAEQDVEYAIRQIVEVGVRALSPGINDPFTAINCIDSLGAVICRVARSGLPGPYRYDSAGKLRVVAPVSTFSGITDAAFNQIRQYGRDSVAVTLRLLEVIAACGQQVTVEDHRQALRRQAEMIYRQSQNANAIHDEGDRNDVQRRHETAMQVLSESPIAASKPTNR